MENFGIRIREIKTDSETEEVIDMDLSDSFTNISKDMQRTTENNDEVQKQLAYMNTDKSISYQQWLMKQSKENLNAVNELLRTPQGRQAWIKEYHQDPEDIEQQGTAMFTIPSSVFTVDLDEEEQPLTQGQRLQRQFNSLGNLR